MNTNKKLEVPSECSTPEFTRFKELAKQLVTVPKVKLKDAEKEKNASGIARRKA